jgi:GNAT superfamily N-acetyltransferase
MDLGMLGGVSVRRRLGNDLADCVEALAAVHAADGYPMCWPTDPAGWLSPPGLAGAWVAKHAGAVDGHVGVVRGVDDPVVTAITGAPTSGLASVTRLFVAPTARGHRLGAALLATAHRWAVDRGLQLMLDVVDGGGPTMALYDRLGWWLVDRRLADWRTSEGRRPPVSVYLAPSTPPPLPGREGQQP